MYTLNKLIHGPQTEVDRVGGYSRGRQTYGGGSPYGGGYNGWTSKRGPGYSKGRGENDSKVTTNQTDGRDPVELMRV